MEKTSGIYVIACGVLARDIRRISKELALSVETCFLPGGLHENPAKLRLQLQEAIDSASTSGDWERIVVGYGLCGRGTVNLRARSVLLVIPKVHDCIALFLGGNAAYKKEFKKYPGTYYISAGWYDEKVEPISQKRPYSYLGDKKIYYDELAEKYGSEHADETFKFLNSWKRNYQRAAFIETGGGNREKYAGYAAEMAQRYGWKYEELSGGDNLLTSLLTARATTESILVVPPSHATHYDSHRNSLAAGPVRNRRSQKVRPRERVEIIKGTSRQTSSAITIGLGVDAGGTYTDAVIFDFSGNAVRAKNKSLTTKWDYSLGIMEAVKGLEPSAFPGIELVTVSTTLATNAIVEGHGQKVGLVLMPPKGLFSLRDIPHDPKAFVEGQIDISGRVVSPIDEEEIRRTGRLMVEKHQVEAFAVSGFAGSINPEHELKIKQMLHDETGLFVTCGHELSDLLDFLTRARTAVLNARIVPRLVKLLKDLQKVLDSLDIVAPVMVVKGDGSLMSSAMAMERPVETILSGPAASVAGARFLTGRQEAIVVDMGGTTTDTATLAGGMVQVCGSGSNLGGQRTHVKALDMRTSGLGGDSLIRYENGDFSIGPRRVTPMAWLGQRYPQIRQSLQYVGSRVNLSRGSSAPLQFFALMGNVQALELSDAEAGIVSLLRQRPHSIDELADKTGVLHPILLPLSRLEENYIIQRCGLTPTDLLHVTGQFMRWDSPTARHICDLMATVCRMNVDKMVHKLLNLVTRLLTVELLKKQLDSETDSDGMDNCPVCRTLLDHLFDSKRKQMSVRFTVQSPIIGIGAPIEHFLAKAAKYLDAEAILPKDAEVANAVGAVTSRISIQRRVKIKPADMGGFLIDGLAGARYFKGFKNAEAYAKNALTEMVRDTARLAGTSQDTVEMRIEDRTVNTSQGDEIFLERIIQAHLVGQPDMANQGNPN